MLSTLLNKNTEIFSELYLIKKQSLNYNDLIIFDSDDSSMREIIVLSTGIYIVNVSCQFAESCIIGLFVNGIEDSIYQTENHYNKIFLNSNPVIPSHLLIHQILNLKANNLISIKYLSNGPNKIINLENKIKIWKLST
jgi:hypothetical protein